jgi:ATP phosphoribosyltransferase
LGCESGRTLAENGLVEVGEIMRVTARLIVNRASQKTKYEEITELVGRLKQML